MTELRLAIIRLFEEGIVVKLGFSTRRRPITQVRRYPEFDPRQRTRVHLSRHQPTEKQRRMATEFARLERDGLQHLEYLGGRGVLEAPPVDRRVEKEFGEGLEQDPSRSH